jgi:phage terminase large subunit
MKLTLQEKQTILNGLIKEDRLRMPEKMKAILKPRRYKFAYGGRGGSKSVSFAKTLLHKANEEKIRVLCAREIQNSIKDSVHSSLKDLIDELGYTEYRVTENSIVNDKTKSEFLFLGLYRQDVKQTIKSYANIDVAWIEEAQSVSKGSLMILDPTIRKENSEIWFSFNRLLPDDPVWMFMEGIEESEKIVIPINHDDNPYLPEVLRKQMLRSKKEYENGVSDDYLHVWLGEPVAYSDRTVLRTKDIIGAVNRKIDGEGQIVIGVDVARFGKDRTVFFKRKGLKIIEWKEYRQQDLITTSRDLVDFVGRNNTHIPIKIDDTGVGGGVTDYLRVNGYNVKPINFGGKAQDFNKYNNVISEMWFYFKSIVNEVSIPDLQELKSELLTREYYIDNKERRCIESKDQYRKRFRKSPDYADALLLCYYNVDSESFYLLGNLT